ncbi:hypothetical protein VNO77_03109 [Canavalia gladiata]|uniref:Uncharacterized protein n=1 Tax=Canavalia gladiata TaxID=3824 RepID=A0AAN9MZ50_CANGL
MPLTQVSCPMIRTIGRLPIAPSGHHPTAKMCWLQAVQVLLCSGIVTSLVDLFGSALLHGAVPYPARHSYGGTIILLLASPSSIFDWLLRISRGLLTMRSSDYGSIPFLSWQVSILIRIEVFPSCILCYVASDLSNSKVDYQNTDKVFHYISMVSNGKSWLCHHFGAYVNVSRLHALLPLLINKLQAYYQGKITQHITRLYPMLSPDSSHKDYTMRLKIPVQLICKPGPMGQDQPLTFEPVNNRISQKSIDSGIQSMSQNS